MIFPAALNCQFHYRSLRRLGVGRVEIGVPIKGLHTNCFSKTRTERREDSRLELSDDGGVGAASDDVKQDLDAKGRWMDRDQIDFRRTALRKFRRRRRKESERTLTKLVDRR